MLHSREDATSKKYLGAFCRWKQCALKHDVKAFPVESKYQALYLQYIGDTVRSKSAVEEVVHAIAWIHSIVGLSSPTCSPFVTIVVEDLHRALIRPIVKKTPFNKATMVKDTHKN